MNTEHTPKVSIITVCRNESKRMIATCESIVAQTWTDWEWIVVDGASTDDTLQVLEPYRGKMAHLVSEPDSGIYDGMNKGIRLAKGEFVCFLNGGDAFHHGTVLEEVFGQAKVKGDILYGAVATQSKGKERVSRPVKKISSPLFFICGNLSHQGAFIRRELFELYGLYDTGLHIVSDWKQWIVFALNKRRFQRVDVCVAKFDSAGVSSEQRAESVRERTAVCNQFFNAGDLADFGFCRRIKWVKLFGFFPFLMITHRLGTTSYHLFGVIPLVSFSAKL